MSKKKSGNYRTITATFQSGAFLVSAGLVIGAPMALAFQQTGGAATARDSNHPVIVIMKNSVTGAAAVLDQGPLMTELHQAGAAHIKSFRLVNAIAATVSDEEIARLKANPAVAQVFPDAVLHRAPRVGTAPDSAAAHTSGRASSLPANVIPGACGENGRVMLEPEALQTTNTNSDDASAPTARSLGLTGAGVRVAWMADGIDPSNVNFVRADGTSAFVDYQDFSGDGPGALTNGDEAFLDANAIAGQGIQVYDVNGYSAQTYPTPCKVRIEGVAPGVEMVGLKIYSQFNDTTASNFFQAIDYAVLTAHVDVLNESFGGNYFPDVTSLDALKVFNDAAIKAGVTVVASSGDAGPFNTIGTPASDPLVISAGGSTTFRFYAQTNYAATRYFAPNGWLNDNISSLSSSGFNETAHTLDLVSPGDLSFASCAASPNFTGCTNFLNQSSAIEESGGTSESAPLTSGAAALVIQAYRLAHAGASPAPALVKQILTSTATDLSVPATEQGAGLLNSYKAVLLAESINDGHTLASSSKSRARNQSLPLLLSDNHLVAVGPGGTTFRWPVTVTNPSSHGQFVSVSGRTFGPVENVQSGTVTLSDAASPQFPYINGLANVYETFSFSVPGNADLLNASIAYPGSPANGLNSRDRLILVDPKGRLAAHSLPQGVGNFGNVLVRKPIPGTWKGIVFGYTTSAGGANGTIPWQVSTQRTVPFGSVSPSSFYVGAGQRQTFQVTSTTPMSSGDTSGSIVVTSSNGGMDSVIGSESNSIPVTLRTLVDPANGGAFSGVLTGGNGRAPGEGQINYYQFRVGLGHASITANVQLTNDAGDAVGAYLISPDGQALGFGQNNAGPTNTLSLTASTLNPMAGSWTLIVEFAEPVVGDELSQIFTGNIQLDDASATAPTLPNSASIQLSAGTPVTIPVTITNNGAGPGAFFIDARLNTLTSAPLAGQGLPNGFNGYPVPNSGGAIPLWLVPTETASLQATASANVPIEFDLGPDAGDPDLAGVPVASTSAGTYNAAGDFTPASGVVSQGLWLAFPQELGPYPSTGEPSGLANMTVTAAMRAFDPAMTSPTGDLWLNSLDASYAGLAPVTINAGATSVINVTITPSGPSGTVVSGTLYVDDLEPSVPPYGQTTGNEVAAIPYSYTVK